MNQSRYSRISFAYALNWSSVSLSRCRSFCRNCGSDTTRLHLWLPFLSPNSLHHSSTQISSELLFAFTQN